MDMWCALLAASTFMCLLPDVIAVFRPEVLDLRPYGLHDVIRYSLLTQRGWLISQQKAKKEKEPKDKEKGMKTVKPKKLKVKGKSKKVPVLETPEVYGKEEKLQIDKKLIPKLDSKPKGKLLQPTTAGRAMPLKPPTTSPASALNAMSIQPQIINGQLALQGQFPWQAAIVCDDIYFCGGSLIYATWVLTAAHCADGVSSFYIKLGATNRSLNESGLEIQTSSTKVVHKDYKEDKIKNDIALIKLKTAIRTPTSYINLIRMPRVSDANKTFEMVKATVSGWGLLSDTDDGVTNNLHFVKLELVTLYECLYAYGKDYIIGANICCSTAGKATCGGDSGGALVYREADGLWTQIGIVSFGSAEGCTKAPSVFTRVSSHIGWISKESELAFRP